MKTSDDLLIYCEDNNIDVTFRKMRNAGSVSFNYNNNDYIGIDDRQMTEAERRVHLAHEIGHCKTGAFYNLYSPIDNRAKHEYTANCWAIKELLPREEMMKAFKQGIIEVWELAEEFNVTEDFIRFACKYYFNRG